MAQKSSQEVLYQDLEKFHRVIGYYEGQEIKPLEIHERFLQQDLDTFIRGTQEYLRGVQFDFFLKRVLSEKKVVFETDRPEVTLLFLLFSEGIKSLMILRDVDAMEVKDWCLLIRRSLVQLDQGAFKDLGSILWRSPFRNIRSRICNAVMDLAEQIPDDEEEESA